LLTNRFDEALTFAHRLHRDQTRKGTNIPYISHLLIVSALVIEHGGNEDQAIAALLHDGPEDQGGEATLAMIREMFGDDVAAIVADCTDSWVEPKPPWRARKEAYLAKLGSKPKASLLVSLADKTHNAEAILHDYSELGDALWSRFNGGKEGTHWYYQSLAAIYRATLPGRLADRCTRAVSAFAGSSHAGAE
jgi:(p)ppGpp synthase/HD superfamily hydrolase